MSAGTLRLEVIFRDGACVASTLDPEAGPCYDAWGMHILPDDLDEMEMDYVRLKATGKRHELASDHVTMCPGHHRGTGPSRGYQWATAHRGELRAYLEERWSS